MAESLNVELRENFGKGHSRRLRAAGKVPAVLYGHGEDPRHFELPGHETALAARNPNALLELHLPDGSSHLALIKEIQRHPLHRTLTHLDLVAVKRGEKVDVDIPVVLTGEATSPAVAFVELQALTLSVDALAVPEQIEVDVEGAEEGFQVFAGDVTLPKGAELASDAELLVAYVSVPRGEVEADEDEESEDEAGESTESAEGEGDSTEE